MKFSTQVLQRWQRFRPTSMLAIAAVVFAATVMPGLGQINIQSAGFTGSNTCSGGSSPTTGCQVTLNVNAGVTGGGALRLTPALGNQTGSAWFVTPQNVAAGFTSTFKFQLSGGSGADGIAFVIQNVPSSPLAAIGFVSNPSLSSGGALGYGDDDNSTNPSTGEGIPNSLAIEFDTFRNGWDPNGNHVAVQSCGTGRNTSHHNRQLCNGTTGNNSTIAIASLAAPTLADGNAHNVTIDYHPPCGVECSNLTVFVDGNNVLQATTDLASIGLTNGQAFVGFTGATGGLDNNQDILSWTLTRNSPTSLTLQGNGAPNDFVTPFADFTVQYPTDGTFVNANGQTPASLGKSIEMTNTQILISVADFDAKLAAAALAGDPFALAHTNAHCLPHNQTGGLCVINRSGCILQPDGTPILCPCTQGLVPNGGHLNNAVCPQDSQPFFTNSQALINENDIWGKRSPDSFSTAENASTDQLTMLTSNDNQVDFVDIGTGANNDCCTLSGGTNNRNSETTSIDTGILLSSLNDTVAPTTTLSTFPVSAISGWVNTRPVTVGLNAVDNPGGSGVKQINYGTAYAPTQPSASIVVPGASTTFQVTNEGVTNIAYQATDNASSLNNVEGLKTQQIKIDLTAPTVSVTGLSGGPNFLAGAGPTPGCNATDPVGTGVNAVSGVVSGGTLTITQTSGVPGSGLGTFQATCSAPVDAAGNTGAAATANYSVLYSTGTCLGDLGHTILQPINADGSSVFKQGSTVPAKFRVCNASGQSVGTPGTVSSFRLIQVIGTTVSSVDEAVFANNPDTSFHFDSTAQQWIFNIGTKPLAAGSTYYYRITLNDGSFIDFHFGLR